MTNLAVILEVSMTGGSRSSESRATREDGDSDKQWAMFRAYCAEKGSTPALAIEELKCFFRSLIKDRITSGEETSRDSGT